MHTHKAPNKYINITGILLIVKLKADTGKNSFDVWFSMFMVLIP